MFLTLVKTSVTGQWNNSSASFHMNTEGFLCQSYDLKNTSLPILRTKRFLPPVLWLADLFWCSSCQQMSLTKIINWHSVSALQHLVSTLQHLIPHIDSLLSCWFNILYSTVVTLWWGSRKSNHKSRTIHVSSSKKRQTITFNT